MVSFAFNATLGTATAKAGTATAASGFVQSALFPLFAAGNRRAQVTLSFALSC